jgi:hypothetical protein
MCPHTTLHVPSYYYICASCCSRPSIMSGSTSNRLTCNRRGFTCNILTCNKLAQRLSWWRWKHLLSICPQTTIHVVLILFLYVSSYCSYMSPHTVPICVLILFLYVSSYYSYMCPHNVPICVLIRRCMDVAASPATGSPAAVLVEEETLATLSTNFARGARQQAHQRSPHSRSNHMFGIAGGIAGGRRRGGVWGHALGGVLGSRPLGFDMSWTPCG